MTIAENLKEIKETIAPNVELIAVSKTYSADVISEAYAQGQRLFGENRPQEMVEKYNKLDKDIQWHMIGTLQTNKVKYIAPFVSMIHSVDSAKLLDTIQKEAVKNKRSIDVLFEIFIAEESTKHGWDYYDLSEFVNSGNLSNYPNICFRGVMGMATFTDNQVQVKREFSLLHNYYNNIKKLIPTFDTISMGMSGDYKLAMECGSTMVRVGSSIFGSR